MVPQPAQFSFQPFLQKWFYWLLGLGILVNATGLLITILEPDGALYAGIAKTMAQSGDFINLKVNGKDWLDKPHFPFWIAALSYKIFGITTFAYKFPAFLFWVMGGWYTYRLAHSLYGKYTAQLSVLIYVTAAHLFISNNDVRAEPYLTGLIIGSVYNFYKASQQKLNFHIVAGSLLAACAVMTKGPFISITIASGFIIDWIIKKQWGRLFHYRWWVSILLIAIFILPELYCLHVQFDMHPEKIVFNRTNVSGIKFFFWDSQFGRFMNTGPIKGEGDPLFYFHTILWAFVPWSLILYVAVINGIKNIGANKLTSNYIPIGSFLVTFIIFSLSKFQLPHYLNFIFPFASIITAQYLINTKRNTLAIQSVQHIVAVLLIVLPVIITWFFRPPLILFISIWLLIGAVATFLLFRKRDLPSAIGKSYLAAVIAYGFLNLFFYPALLKYQSGSEAALYLNTTRPSQPVILVGDDSYSFSFYLHAKYSFVQTDSFINMRRPALVFTKQSTLDSLNAKGIATKPIKSFTHFHISRLTGEFLNHKTRAKVVEDFVIAGINF